MSSTTRPSAREALVEAAFSILSRNPGAPLAEIAEHAGVGRATLHRYFSSRDDLVLELAQLAIAETDQAANAACEGVESCGEALRLTLRALIPLGNRHGFLALEPLNSALETMTEYKRQLDETRDMIEGAKTEGLFDTHVPTDWILQAYLHLLFAAWEAVRTESATPAQSADLAWRTLTEGLGRQA